MEKETKRSNRERIKYGICLNDECKKCKTKEVQQIPLRKDFVCDTCGNELRECPAPKRASRVPLIIVAVVVVAIAVIGGGYYFSQNRSTENLGYPAVSETDSVIPVVADPKPEALPTEEKPEKTSIQQANRGTINLGYGSYTGDLKNGKPHGHGTITYTATHQIVSSKDFVANPGDKFEGEFRNGNIEGGIGYWYHDNGEITAVKP